MAYTTLAKIRSEAGFTNNANVSDAKISTYHTAATSQIDGVLYRAYALPLSETPPILELIERKLAAGHLLLDQYGEQAEGTSFDGKSKVKWAEDMLEQIENGYVTLIGADGNPLNQVSNKVNMSGWPNDSTGTDKTDQSDKDDPPIMEIGMKF